MILREKVVPSDHFLVNNDRQGEEVVGDINTKNNENENDSLQAAIHQMLRQLSPDELETAARFSHDYLTLNNNNNAKEEELNNNGIITNNKKTKKDKHLLQIQYAKRLAAIYLLKHNSDSNIEQESNNSVTANGDAVKRALAELKATLKFRKQFNVDRLRTAFDKQHDTVPSQQDDCCSSTSGSTLTRCSSSDFHETLYHNLGSKKLYVQGYDRDGRSTYIFIPRNVQHHDAEWTLREHVYTLERALACTKARDYKVNAIVDFNGYNRNKHAPPMRMGIDFLNVLGHYYGPCLNRVFIVDAPMAFLVVWTMLKPIINKLASRNKVNIEFVQSSSKQGHNSNKNNHNNNNNNHCNSNILERYYEPHEAASWMLPTGTKNRDLDVHEYLHQTPFNQAFDEQL